MTKKEPSKTNDDYNEIFEESAPVFKSDIDFWQRALTEYGEFDSAYQINLLVKKLKTETKREQAKIKKKKRLVAQRNQAAKKKVAQKQKIERHLYASLPNDKKIEIRQKRKELKMLAKQKSTNAKDAKMQAVLLAKQNAKEKKAEASAFRMEERLFLLSLTPDEKAHYNFLRKGKKRIETATAQLQLAKQKQLIVAKSNIMPITSFLWTLLFAVIITATISFFATNMYLDTQAYSEKIDLLKTGITESSAKLDGDMVVGVGDLEAGLSVYQQLLSHVPIVEEQLLILNNSYYWVFNKETPKTMGMNDLDAKAVTLKKDIDKIQAIVDANNAFTEKIDTAYQTNTNIENLSEDISSFSIAIDKLIYDFDSLSFPKGLPDHKTLFKQKIVANQDYLALMIEYVNGLMAVREQMDSTDSIISKAENIDTHSGSLDSKVDDYIYKLAKAVALERQIILLNNTVGYATIIGKKDFDYVANGIVSESSLDFYTNIKELRNIVGASNKVQRVCLDLPYPKVQRQNSETILSHMNQGTTDKALETNKELEARIAAVKIPNEISSAVRGYATGLELRTEFLILQKQYIDLSLAKDLEFSAYSAAKAVYDTAKSKAVMERYLNGRSTDLYKQYKNEIADAEVLMDTEEAKAAKAADVIQEQMKDVRAEAAALKKEYEGYMDY